MVTRTTDIDHPDRNCVSRACDLCGKVFYRLHHESSAYLDNAERGLRAVVQCKLANGGADLCRKCEEQGDASQKA